MDVYFHDAALAALCNSERGLAERWGAGLGRAIGRRLLEVGATDAANLQRLPRAEVSRNDGGETTIDFGDVVINGTIRGDGRHGEQIVISSIEAEGSVEP